VRIGPSSECDWLPISTRIDSEIVKSTLYRASSNFTQKYSGKWFKGHAFHYRHRFLLC
jgi:hypothetical protein